MGLYVTKKKDRPDTSKKTPDSKKADPNTFLVGDVSSSVVTTSPTSSKVNFVRIGADGVQVEPSMRYVHPLAVLLDNFARRMRKQFTPRRTLVFWGILIWTIVLWSVLVAKIDEEETTLSHTFSYYTNITFAVQAIFFSVYLCSFFERAEERKLETLLLTIFLLIVYAQIYLVALLVMFVLYDAPELVTSEMKSMGGNYNDGLVLLGDRIFHVLPAFVMSIFLFAVWPDYSDLCASEFAIFSVPIRKDKMQMILDKDRTGSLSITELVQDAYNFDELTDAEKTNSIPPESDVLPSYVPKSAIGALYQFYVRDSDRLHYLIFEVLMSALPFLIYMIVIDIHNKYGVEQKYTSWILVLAIFGLSIGLVVAPIYFLFNSSIPSYFATREEASKIFAKNIAAQKKIRIHLKRATDTTSTSTGSFQKNVSEINGFVILKPSVSLPR